MGRFAGLSWLLATCWVVAGCAHLGPDLSAHLPKSRDSDETLYSVARLHERHGKLRDAQKTYDAILRRRPDDVDAWHRLGVVHTRLGDHDKAERAFRKALERQPHNVEILTDLGYAHFLRNNFDAAETALRQALQEAPRHQRAANNLALVLAHQGDFEESYALFRQVVGDAEAHANVAYIHVQRGEGALAIERYSRALSLDPNLRSASHALLQIAEMQQRAHRAEGRNAPAIARRPPMPSGAGSDASQLANRPESAAGTERGAAGRVVMTAHSEGVSAGATPAAWTDDAPGLEEPVFIDDTPRHRPSGAFDTMPKEDWDEFAPWP